MNAIQLFAHAEEVHESSGQSFIHFITAWYIVVPFFTIAITLVVALLTRKLLDTYDTHHSDGGSKDSTHHSESLKHSSTEHQSAKNK